LHSQTPIQYGRGCLVLSYSAGRLTVLVVLQCWSSQRLACGRSRINSSPDNRGVPSLGTN
jgi:hypothetical protein